MAGIGEAASVGNDSLCERSLQELDGFCRPQTENFLSGRKSENSLEVQLEITSGTVQGSDQVGNGKVLVEVH